MRAHFNRFNPRPKGDNVSKWKNISVHYPGATTEIDHNFINLTIPWPGEEHEFAVSGTPEKEDKKRGNICNWECLVKTKRKERTPCFTQFFFLTTL